VISKKLFYLPLRHYRLINIFELGPPFLIVSPSHILVIVVLLYLQVHVEEREQAVLVIVLAANLWLILTLNGSRCLLEIRRVAVLVGTGIKLGLVPRLHTGITLLEEAVNENCAAQRRETCGPRLKRRLLKAGNTLDDMAVSVIGVVHGLGKRMELFTAAGRGRRTLTMTTVNGLLRNVALPALLTLGLVPVDLVFSVGPADQLNFPVGLQHTNDLGVR